LYLPRVNFTHFVLPEVFRSINLTELKPYIIALAVGLLVGIERENSKADEKAIGVRTFLLLSLLGAIAGDLQNFWLTAVISIFALGLIVTSYIIQIYSIPVRVQLGLTTEFAAAIVYTVGVAAHTSPILAATIGPLVALILFSKTPLHSFTHDLKPIELKAAITILLIAAVVIELAPNTTIDPWGLLNPRKFGYLILILATLEFSSYILLKVIGEKKGSIVVGFLGGLVSSTAVLISSVRQSIKSAESWRTFICSVLAAQMASLLELLVIVSLISQTLFLKLLPAVAAGIIFCGICLGLMWLKQIPQSSELVLKSPLDWKGVLRLSVIFGILLMLVSLAKNSFGQDAMYSLSFLTGLFELQGISLANATLFSHEQVSLNIASFSILLAVIASLIGKVSVSWFFSRSKFSAVLTLIFLPMISIIILVAWLQLK
jgi:uncharacterized membrane protein (DUF4010 family)